MESTTFSLVDFANQLTRVIVPIIIIIGVIGNILNIIVLTQPILYKHACSRYFLAHASANIFYVIIVALLRLLTEQYHIDLTRRSIVLCTMHMYVGNLIVFLPPSFLLLASVDRWCASSINPRRRYFSNIRIARRMILSTIIVLGLFFINSAVLVDIRDTDPFGCIIRADTVYKQVYAYMQIIIISFLIPLLMALFGIMTIYNIKRPRILPVVISRDRRTGRQLYYMLLCQVGCHVILNLPSSITYLIFSLPNEIKTTSNFFAASILCTLPYHVLYITAFFLYILSSQMYRRELIQLKNKIFGHPHNVQVGPRLNIHVVQTLRD